MQLIEDFQINIGSKDLAQDCYDLAKCSSIKQGTGDQKTGFVLGVETLNDYKNLLSNEYSLILTDKNNTIRAFLIGSKKGSRLFEQRFTQETIEELNCNESFQQNNLFYIDKVLVHPDAKRKGYAGKLYHKLFRDLSGYTFCAYIVHSPLKNDASIQFHLKNGFVQKGSLKIKEFDGIKNIESFIYFKET